MNQKIIELKNVFKNYGRTEALKDVCLALYNHDILGLVGPNGAGKTTMIRLICTLLTPTKGKLYFLNKEYSQCKRDVKSNIGYLKEVTNLYNKISVLDNIKIFAMGRGINAHSKNLLDFLDEWNLSPLRNRIVSTLSNGQKKILALHCSILHDPEIVILDEPFSGLDIEVKELIRNRICMLKERNKTILISSHDIDEIEKIATKISIIDQGKIVLGGTTDEIKKSILGTVYEIIVDRIPEDMNALPGIIGQIKINNEKKSIIIKVQDEAFINNVLSFLIGKNIIIKSSGKLKLEEHLIELFKN